MKILVTGGTGFLGCSLVKKLKELGYDVIISTRQYHNVDESVYNMGNIDSNTNWKSIVSGCDAVIHTAGRAHMLKDHADEKLTEFRRVNRDATLKLAQDSVEMGVRHFIFISSIGVNGNSTNNTPFTEYAEPAPVSEYAISKYEAEKELQSRFSDSRMAVTIIRPALICGENAPGNIHRLLALVSSGIPIPLRNTNNRRAMVSLDNVVSFIICCLVNKKSKNEIYLLADNDQPSTSEIIKYFSEGMNKKSRLFSFPSWIISFFLTILNKKNIYEQLYGSLEVDASKAREHLLWKPSVSIYETMKKTAAYYCKDKK